jgi:hypothetical protein
MAYHILQQHVPVPEWYHEIVSAVLNAAHPAVVCCCCCCSARGRTIVVDAVVVVRMLVVMIMMKEMIMRILPDAPCRKTVDRRYDSRWSNDEVKCR